MRMHPVRAGNRSIVIGLNRAIRDRRGLRPGEAILRPGRQLPMPMDDGGCASLIDELHAKPLAGGEAKAPTSIRTYKTEDPCWPANQLQHACFRDEAPPDHGSR